MSIEENLRSIARELKGVKELGRYDSGEYGNFDEIEDHLSEEWESYKQQNNLEELGDLDGTFVVEQKSGFIGSERLTVQSADYVVNFEAYNAEESDDQMYEAEYLCTFDFGGQEGGDVPAFFRGFLDQNFERVDE